MEAIRDGNHVPVALGVSTSDATLTLPFMVDPATGRLQVASTGGGGTPGGLNTQLQYNNNGAFGGITGAVTDGTAVSLTAAHLLNPTINGAGTGLATLAYPNTSASPTLTLPTTTDTLIGKATTDTLTNKTYDTAGAGNSFSIAGTAITAVNGTGAVSLTTNPVFVTPNIGAATGTTLALTNTSATGLVVGANGATNPALTVDSSATSAATGIAIISAAAGGNAMILATSSAGNETFTISSKGTGTLALQANQSATSRINISSTVNTYTNGSHAFSAGAGNTAATIRFSVVNAADTTLSAGVEATYAYFNLANNIRTHASNTAIATQRDMRVSGTTQAFATAGGTITNAAAFAVDLGSAGTNATITNLHGIYMPTTAVTGTVTSAYGLTIAAPSGATSNLAAQFTGAVRMNTTVVASLPSASGVGAGSRMFVTDALGPTFGATVVGGGAIPVPVYSDGTNWKVG